VGNPELYPQRNRDTNVRLIKDVIGAPSQGAHDEALARFASELHPSLFAELDWMEMTGPEHNRERAVGLIDALFLNHLEQILEARSVQFELDEDDLFDEVLENYSFYMLILQEAPEIAKALSPALRARIQAHYEATDRERKLRIPERHAALQEGVHSTLSSIRDRTRYPLVLTELVTNEIVRALDHPSSRMRAKRFLRKLGGRFPQFPAGELARREDLEGLIARVRAVDEAAREFALLRLLRCTQAILQHLEERDILALDRFEGEWATGYGPCRHCAMMFASSAVIFLDPTCPLLGESDEERIHLPLAFNVATCPFCGTRQRSNAPSMFYWPSRKKVLYCVPRDGSRSEGEAEAAHRDTIQEIRRRYMERIGAEEAAAFEAAAEEIVYSMIHFIVAIQMGTANRVHHAFLRVRLAGGTSLIVDQTTKVSIELINETETLQLWNLREYDLGDAGDPDRDQVRGLVVDALSRAGRDAEADAVGEES
jgi:hypothetical protein